MKIVLHAFGNKLSGVMEVPENTTPEFKLALTQPVQYKYGNFGDDLNRPMMDNPLHTICTFQYTGAVYVQTGHAYDGAKIYQLVKMEKQ